MRDKRTRAPTRARATTRVRARVPEKSIAAVIGGNWSAGRGGSLFLPRGRRSMR